MYMYYHNFFNISVYMILYLNEDLKVIIIHIHIYVFVINNKLLQIFFFFFLKGALKKIISLMAYVIFGDVVWIFFLRKGRGNRVWVVGRNLWASDWWIHPSHCCAGRWLEKVQEKGLLNDPARHVASGQTVLNNNIEKLESKLSIYLALHISDYITRFTNLYVNNYTHTLYYWELKNN